MISPSALLLQRGRCPQLVCGFLAASMFWSMGLPGLMPPQVLSQSNAPGVLTPVAPSPLPNTPLAQNPQQAAATPDPLNSPYPVPWNLIWQHQTQATQSGKGIKMQHRSAALVSPDGKRSAYAEISIHLDPTLTQSRIFSNLIITDEQGTVLQQIPSSMHIGDGLVKETTATQVGTLSILVPAAWSKDGQQLLVRQFEAILGSDVSSDYALIWNRKTQQAKTIAPSPMDYDTATLLGWNDRNPAQVLFRTAILGEQNTTLVAVTNSGTTIALQGDHPLPLGLTPSPSVSDP